MIRYQAAHDPLTSLPNRVLFQDRLVQALARPGAQVAVVLLDIDNFKLVNDSLGHSAGDELLMKTAPRLQTALRPGDTIARLGGVVLKMPYTDWWEAIVSGRVAGVEGFFVHPVSDPAVMAGNGTIGLEILEDLPDVDAVVIPYGGGGLTAGIASALRELRPSTRVYTVEPETAAAVVAARAAGEPVAIDYVPSWVDGSGSRGVLADMWPQVAPLIDDALIATLEETAGAVRLIAERLRVIAEGAGALAVAAALAGRAGGGRIVAIVSGGNIDSAVLTRILAGETP